MNSSTYKKYSLGKYSLIFNTSLLNHTVADLQQATPQRGESSFEFTQGEQLKAEATKNLLSHSLTLKLRNLI